MQSRPSFIASRIFLHGSRGSRLRKRLTSGYILGAFGSSPESFLRALGAFFLLVSLTLFCFLSERAFADEDTAPPLHEAEESLMKSLSTGHRFIDDAKVNFGLYYFQRYRTRKNIDRNNRYEVNLDHATINVSAEFLSGFAGDVIGFDFGIFGAKDLRQKGAVDHEMGFVPWKSPWKADYSDNYTNAATSIYKAHIKLKLDDFWAKAGYFQPSGPGVLGVNWSLLPGTYEGVEAGGKFGNLKFAGAVAWRYKSPWYEDVFSFKKGDGTTNVPWLWSLGARYDFENGLGLELAYGESDNYLRNTHLKAGYKIPFDASTLELGYHLYAMWDHDKAESPNACFDGIARQHFLYAWYTQGLWNLRFEATYTRAPQSADHHLGYFAYRLTVPNGSSKGAYEAWWDARSDWNADKETALYFGFTRQLDDLIGLKGFYIGAGYCHGFDGEAYGYSQHLKERAYTFDIGYVVPDGYFKNSFIKLHYTEYKNDTTLRSWEGYKNVFQDERDLKFMVGIPFEF